MRWIRQLLASEDGPTAVEYAVLLALIIVVCIASITVVGTETNKSVQNSKNQMVNYGLGK